MPGAPGGGGGAPAPPRAFLGGGVALPVAASAMSPAFGASDRPDVPESADISDASGTPPGACG
ncbi:hypothetical protein ACQ4WX_21460 [Streptomyces lasalocidi]